MLSVAGLANQHREAQAADAAATQKYEETKQVVPMGASPKGHYTDPKAYRDEWRSERDLEAQREMADWSLGTMIASFIGVVLITATLWETTRTTIAATEAAEAAQRQADISEKALREARNSGIATERALLIAERPWLSVEPSLESGFMAEGADTSFIVGLHLMNHGNSPAVTIEMTIVVCPLDEDALGRLDGLIAEAQSGIDRVPPPRYAHHVFPKGGALHNVKAVIKTQDVAAAMARTGSNTVHPAVVGLIEYRNAFSYEQHYTTFIAEIARIHPENPNQLLPLEASEAGVLLAQDVPINQIDFRPIVFRGRVA